MKCESCASGRSLNGAAAVTPCGNYPVLSAQQYHGSTLSVKSALPAIDDRAPTARPHVALKLKKSQREAERTHKIQRDNFSLLQRLGAIMRHNRLDNHWRKPLPDFHKKVGQFFDSASIRERERLRARAPPAPGRSSVRCHACEYRKTRSKQAFEMTFDNDDSIELPPINMY